MNITGDTQLSVGEALFGSEEAMQTWWLFSRGFLTTEENALRAIQTLLRAPFDPCFHCIQNTQFFLPFGVGRDVSKHIYLDLFSAPEPMVAALAPLIPSLQTRSWHETRRDSVISPRIPVDWEYHRAALVEYYLRCLKEASSDPARVEQWFGRLKEK